MKKRIQIDGKWYVEESTLPEQDFDITFSYEASSGMFDYSVCLKEVDDNQRFEVYTGTESISAYLKGRDKEPEIWDNSTWLRDFRDGIKVEGGDDLTMMQTAELQDLLIAVTEKGWL
jgi:hypothetical protein